MRAMKQKSGLARRAPSWEEGATRSGKSELSTEDCELTAEESRANCCFGLLTDCGLGDQLRTAETKVDVVLVLDPQLVPQSVVSLRFVIAVGP